MRIARNMRGTSLPFIALLSMIAFWRESMIYSSVVSIKSSTTQENSWISHFAIPQTYYTFDQICSSFPRLSSSSLYFNLKIFKIKYSPLVRPVLEIALIVSCLCCSSPALFKEIYVNNEQQKSKHYILISLPFCRSNYEQFNRANNAWITIVSLIFLIKNKL